MRVKILCHCLIVFDQAVLFGFMICHPKTLLRRRLCSSGTQHKSNVLRLPSRRSVTEPVPVFAKQGAQTWLSTNLSLRPVDDCGRSLRPAGLRVLLLQTVGQISGDPQSMPGLNLFFRHIFLRCRVPFTRRQITVISAGIEEIGWKPIPPMPMWWLLQLMSKTVRESRKRIPS